MDIIIGIIILAIFIMLIVAFFAINSNIKDMQKTLRYLAKYISYKEIYYCPFCLELSRVETKCPGCGKEMVKK